MYTAAQRSWIFVQKIGIIIHNLWDKAISLSAPYEEQIGVPIESNLASLQTQSIFGNENPTAGDHRVETNKRWWIGLAIIRV